MSGVFSKPDIPAAPPVPKYVPPPVKDEKIVNAGIDYRRRIARSSGRSTIMGGSVGEASTKKTLLGS